MRVSSRHMRKPHQERARPSGRPPAGAHAGEKVRDYPQISLRVPPDMRSTVRALAAAEARPQWRVIMDALDCYLRELSTSERQVVAQLVERSTKVPTKHDRLPGAARNVEGQTSHTTTPSPASHSEHFHAVRFYEDDDSLCRIVAAFLRDGILEGQPAMAIATPVHRAAIRRELQATVHNLASLERSAGLLFLDAEKTMSGFMVGDAPDEGLFTASIGGAMTHVCGARTDCIIRAYGEMVDLLWKRGNRTGAIQLETLWNQLATSHAFSLLCGYSMRNFYEGAGLADVCRLHTHVISETGQALAFRN
jgi:hypothetical protein